jgi:peptide/nickel transport system ATP-binding protein
MGLMAQSVDRIGVMYAGRLVELGPVAGVFASPRHPYTRLLIRSVPSLDARGALRGIPGLPPSLRTPPPGCPFHPRCPDAVARCRAEIPEPRAVAPDRIAACHLA